MTKIGVCRAYVAAYLAAHPGINHEMTQMVRQLAPGPAGLPLELYCFTARTAWRDYEAVQADIFDHLLAVMPEFALRLFQPPSAQHLPAALQRDAAGSLPRPDEQAHRLAERKNVMQGTGGSIGVDT